MPKPKITLLILTLNEIVGVQAILPEIDRYLFSQIIVVDGGSSDGTQAWCNENGYEVFIQKRRGVRYAYFDVWPLVTGDYVVTISPDGNCDVSKLPELIELMMDCDLVIGSRYTQGSSSEDDDIVTAFGNWMFNFVAHVFFKSNIKDVMVIYRGYRKNLVSELDLFNEKNYRLPEKIFFTRISWEPLMSIRAVKSGKSVKEFSAGEPARIGGERKLQIFRWGAAYMFQFVKERVIW
jgi:glycosyltransferase involved in cell wall biosynthesis